MQSADIKIHLEILIKEYPTINFTSDSNIERYFELRQNGKTHEALAVYNAHIRMTYPDEAFRTELMKAYRSRSADFVRLLHISIIKKAQQLAHNITNVVTLLIDDIASLNLNDAYTVIRTLDHMLLSLSHNKFEAISKAEKLKLYAHMLSFREKDMDHVVAVLRLYVTDGMAMVQDFKKNIARVQHQDRQQHLQRKIIDFKKMQFSDYDVARIIIAPSIKRPEDKVLAYCIKYWNMVFNADFERTIYLYSKKYESRHYDIFVAIKRGRTMKRRDEEILNLVLSFVTSGYYYNINGDLYLQHMWYRVKAQLAVSSGNSNLASTESRSAPALPAPSPIHENIPPTKVAPATKVPKTTAAKPAASKMPAQLRKEPSKVKALATKVAMTENIPPTKVAPATKVPKTTAAKPAASKMPAQLRKEPSKVKPLATKVVMTENIPPTKVAPATKVPKTTAAKPVARKAPALSTAAKPVASKMPAQLRKEPSKVKPLATKVAMTENIPPTKTAPATKVTLHINEENAPYPSHIIEKKAAVYTESVSDIIKRVSDTPYDLYKDLFFAQVRPSIRAVLSKNKIKKSLFDANQNKGEEILYIFLQENYENPFMNWANSNEKRQLNTLGYQLNSIEAIITHWHSRRSI